MFFSSQLFLFDELQLRPEEQCSDSSSVFLQQNSQLILKIGSPVALSFQGHRRLHQSELHQHRVHSEEAWRGERRPVQTPGDLKFKFRNRPEILARK